MPYNYGHVTRHVVKENGELVANLLAWMNELAFLIKDKYILLSTFEKFKFKVCNLK